MKPALRNFALCFAVLAAGPAAIAETAGREALFDLALDIDGDGKMDRAVLVGGPGSDHAVFKDGESSRLSLNASPDLYIYLGAGAEKLDLSRAPDVMKKAIGDPDSNYVFGLETTPKGALVVKTSYTVSG